MRGRWRTFLLWTAVAVALLGAFWHRLDWSLIRESLRRVNVPVVLLAVLPILLTYLTRSLRWRALLAPIGSPTLGNTIAATVIGFSMIFAFGRIGEAARPLVLSLRERIRPSATIATILLERICDMLAVALAFALSLPFVSGPDDLQRPPAAFARLAGAALALSILGLVGLSALCSQADGILDVLERRSLGLPRKLRQPILNLLRHLAEGLSTLRDTRALARIVVYTILTWGLVVLSFWLVAFAFGLRLTTASVIFVIGFAMVGSLVPTPGGSAGAFHTMTMLGLMGLGIEKNKAASMALIMHLVSFGPAILVSPCFFRREGLSWATLRELMMAETALAEPTSGEVEGGVAAHTGRR
jgi:uncharacterized protein (TIRG00374 family)